MNICVYCEQWIDEDSVFCPHCGARITYSNITTSPSTSNSRYTSNQQPRFVSTPKPYQQQYLITPVNQPYRSDYNTFQYQTNNPEKVRTAGLLIVLILNYTGIGILFLLSLMIFALNPFVGLIFFAITALFLILTYYLQEYDNTARQICIVLVGIGLFINLLSFSIISIVIGIFEIYVLAFHEPTVILFTGQPGYNNNPYNPYPDYRNY